jgi:putative membrane-bound dehydrogenase-like protein
MPFRFLFPLLLCVAGALPATAADFPKIYNTEKTPGNPLPPDEAAAAIKLPPGFRATCFAAEPDVQQPIAMALDARGRLWVAECYTYAESSRNFDEQLRDRIIILEDRDQDGHFDSRKVFWDEGRRLTSIELGFGGVWATCAPQLLFIPDRDGDDVPDAAPEVVLDGFDAGRIRHNIVNGLRWGPDGWLYGRHGIQNYSLVGKPGEPPEQRTRLSCCIWRFHPTRRIFEVVAEGTTNPWGMDWNAFGDAFFTNTVIGHLWHLIPGAHYRRMYGEDLNPHVYQLMEQCADHFHWDTGQDWTKSRASESGRVSEKNDTLGGGHAHCGALIYQADAFPSEWRGKLLTLNFHGRRINVDRLERDGSGYTGKHDRDFAFFGDPWFRGVDLIQAPDGGIYIADWSDAGECHDNDGIHRTSGRIFKIVAGNQNRNEALPIDLRTWTDGKLIAGHDSKNEWIVRTARRLLQERSAQSPNVADELRASLSSADALRATRALWTLAACDRVTMDDLAKTSRHSDENVRAVTVRLLAERLGSPAFAKGTSPPEVAALRNLAAKEESPRVRLALAAALQRVPLPDRAGVADPLLRSERPTDRNLALALWYGIEAIAHNAKGQSDLAALAVHASVPLVRQLATRRLAEENDLSALDSLLAQAAASDHLSDGARTDLLAGMQQGFRGRARVVQPPHWSQFAVPLDPVNPDVRALAALFGDGRAVADIRRIALDNGTDYGARRAALETLIEMQDAELRKTCAKLIDVRELAAVAVRGLATFNDPEIAELLLQRYFNLWEHDRPAVIAALASRPVFAHALLDRIKAGKLPRSEVSVTQARQIRNLHDPEINRQLAEVWGTVSESNEAKRASIDKWKKTLTSERLASARAGVGRGIFNRTCATCHRLFGEGTEFGPDLTGSDRRNLAYLLENIVDPNATVPIDARMLIARMKDGRVLTGLPGPATDRNVTIRAVGGGKEVVERAQIAGIEQLPQSIMPEGLLDAMDEQSVADLMTYLMSPSQVSAE